MRDLWKNYSFSERIQLSALMEMFELMYPLAKEQQACLVPCLLGSELAAPPPRVPVGAGSHRLSLVLSCAVLPANLFPRFLVRIHRYNYRVAQQPSSSSASSSSSSRSSSSAPASPPVAMIQCCSRREVWLQHGDSLGHIFIVDNMNDTQLCVDVWGGSGSPQNLFGIVRDSIDALLLEPVYRGLQQSVQRSIPCSGAAHDHPDRSKRVPPFLFDLSVLWRRFEKHKDKDKDKAEMDCPYCDERFRVVSLLEQAGVYRPPPPAPPPLIESEWLSLLKRLAAEPADRQEAERTQRAMLQDIIGAVHEVRHRHSSSAIIFSPPLCFFPFCGSHLC
jgi:hypothetical protein